MTTSYCRAGMHMRDVDGTCLECGDENDRVGELRELTLPVAAVVLAEGPVGTAWQRMASTGIWHSTTGRRATWGELVKRDRPASRIRIVYLPPAES